MTNNIINPLEITLDFYNNETKFIRAKQYDKKSRFVLIHCTERGVPVLLDNTKMQCKFKMFTPDNRAIYNDAVILDDGNILVELTESCLVFAGKGRFELDVIYFIDEDDVENSGRLLSTMNCDVIIEKSVYSNDKIIASDEFNALTKILTEEQSRHDSLEKLEKEITLAEEVRNANENNRIESENNRNIAETSREETFNVLMETANEEVERLKQENDTASASAELAKQYEESAKNSAQTATEQATIASTSASSASTSEQNAKTSEDNAKASETSASESAISAKENAETATTMATSASKSATNASTSEQNASASATKASESATTATEKATEASTYSNLSKSYAVGTDGEIRENDAVDNAKYYYEQTKGISTGLQGGLIPMGTITFSQLESQTKQSGYMYNIRF